MSEKEMIEKIMRKLDRVDISIDQEEKREESKEILKKIYKLCLQLPKKEKSHRDEQTKLYDLTFYGHVDETSDETSEETDSNDEENLKI